MKSGTTPTKKIKINVDPELIDTIIFTIKNGKGLLIKRYPDEVTYKDTYYLLNFTQKETVRLRGFCLLEAQINFSSGAVAKTEAEKFYVPDTLYTEILGNHAGGGEDEEFLLSSSDMIVVESKPTEVYASNVIGLDLLIPKAMTAQELRRILGKLED